MYAVALVKHASHADQVIMHVKTLMTAHLNVSLMHPIVHSQIIAHSDKSGISSIVVASER